MASPTRSPVNQVFQWAVQGAGEQWSDGSRREAAAYLWIPEKCTRVRGLLIFGANVPEHMLVGHPVIRAACAKNDLGIVWAVPSFWSFSKSAKGRDDLQVAFLERLLRQLADKSGYEEVANAPWLPIGESGHLLMVAGLINQRPGKCIAGICVKNPHEPADKTVPMLWTLGTAQEWGQQSKDIRTSWRDTGNYPQWCSQRADHSWPLSLVIEHGTGHFYCTEAMVGYFAEYITAAAQARLPSAGAGGLQPVDLESGVLAGLPVDGRTDLDIIPYREASAEQRQRPWFFNERLAKEAQRLSEPGPATEAQFASLKPGDGCRIEPYALNSVTKLFVSGDGAFSVRPVLLEKIPEGFIGAGQALARANEKPSAEWICGPFAPAGDGQFRIAADRTWSEQAAAYLIVRHEGDERVRRTVQPVHVTLVTNREGRPQTIDFAPIPDVPAGTASVPLQASSDAGLPVSFFVSHGPAIIENNTLEILPLPPRTRYPVEISVTAWQWGRSSDPPVQTATPVTRKFHILKP